ncbi:MAG: hypothetical protein ACYC6N_18505 [Pirellulaceae bacterium]
MTQEEKIFALILFILLRLFRNGCCSEADVEADAVAAGMKGRTELQLSCGLGGKGGLLLLRDKKNVLLCRDNILNCITRLGAARFDAWLAKEGISEEEFGAWFQKLPSVK